MPRAVSLAVNDEAVEVEVEAGELNGDLHVTPEYRAHLVHVKAKRAVRAILAPSA